MSYQEELLIRIRSAYEAGGFSSLSTDMSKAKEGYIQVANTATNSTSKLAAAGTAGTRSGELIAHGATTGEKGLEALAHRGESMGHAIAQGAEVGVKGLDKVSEAGSKAGSNVAKGGQVGAAGLNNISRAGSGAISTLDGLNTVIGGIIGGFGLMTVATAAWSGSSTAEFNKNWLATKVGTEAANQYVDSIGKIVSEVPGDDSFMNQLLTGAITKQTNLTNSELVSLGNSTADYLTESQRQGKSAIETQMDLKEYIQSGNTTQLERDSILKQQIGTLEGQGTVSERILALNKALTAEGLQGISATEATALTWEEVKGKLQASATTLGTKFLPYINQALNFLLAMDDQTGGLSTQMILIAGGAVALVGALGLISGPIKNAVGDAKDLVGWIKDKIPGTKTTTVKCVKDPSCTGSSGSSTTTTGLSLGSLKTELAAAFTGSGAGAIASGQASGALFAATFLSTAIAAMAAIFGVNRFGYYLQSWLNSEASNMSGPAEKFGIDFGMALLGGLLPGIGNAFRQGSAAAGNSFLQWFGQFDWAKAAQDRINQDLGNLKIQLGGVLDWGNWVKAPGQIMEIVSWLNKVICAIRGCSPGIIPSLLAMQIVFIQVFNAVKAPVMVVWNLIMLFANFVMTQIRSMGNTVIMIWNTVTGTVSVWISTGVNVATGAINWAVGVWNWATGTISVWVGTGVSVATNAIDTAWAYWQRLKDFVKDPIQGVINIVTQAASAGSPYEIDYLYGQGSYYEPNYTPISTTSAITPVATVTSTSSKTVITPVFNIESVNSKEEADYLINRVTKELSDLNDSKGN
nr:hypothetical protein [uncultured Methanobacterium sp.]